MPTLWDEIPAIVKFSPNAGFFTFPNALVGSAGRDRLYLAGAELKNTVPTSEEKAALCKELPSPPTSVGPIQGDCEVNDLNQVILKFYSLSI